MREYVGVLVRHNKEFLLCKRSPKSNSLPGMWSVPAGKLETHETTHEGAKREFYEETNIHITNRTLTPVATIDRYSRDGSKINGRFNVFLLDSPDAKLVPDLENAMDGDEHTECGYFTYEELNGLYIDDKMMTLIKSLS